MCDLEGRAGHVVVGYTGHRGSAPLPAPIRATPVRVRIIVGLLPVSQAVQPLRVISGSADHVDGLPRARPVYLSKRTGAGTAGLGSAMGQFRTHAMHEKIDLSNRLLVDRTLCRQSSARSAKGVYGAILRLGDELGQMMRFRRSSPPVAREGVLRQTRVSGLKAR